MLRESQERGAWWAAVYGVAQSWTRLKRLSSSSSSSPITSWQIDGENVETVPNFIFLGSKMTVDGAMKLKRCLFLGRQAMTNLDSVLKSRDITLPTKVRIVIAMVFLVACMNVRVGP